MNTKFIKSAFISRMLLFSPAILRLAYLLSTGDRYAITSKDRVARIDTI